jgi:ABC-type multidrug transport system fused ATPase/permease subunit
MLSQDVEPEGARPRGIFAGLSGASSDRVGLSQIWRLYRRTLPVVMHVWPHLLALMVLTLFSLLIGVRIALCYFDAFWQGVAQGEPIQSVTALLLGLDPAAYVRVTSLDETARYALRDRVMIALLPAGVMGTIQTIGLLYYGTWILQRINQQLRVRLLEKYQTLSLRFHADARVGDSIYRIYQDSAVVTNVIRSMIIEPLFYAVIMAAGLIYVTRYSGVLALVLLAAVPLCLYLAGLLSGRMRHGFRAAREANSDLTARIQETLSGIRVIKAFGAEGREQRRFERDSMRAFGMAYRARTLFATYGVLLFWIIAPSLLFATLIAISRTNEASSDPAARAALAGAIVWTIATLQSFQFVSGLGVVGMEGLFNVWGRAQDIVVGLDRVFEVLDTKAEIQDAPDAMAMPALQDGIRFEGVRFAYNADRPVLRDVSFAARPGTITAIVGPTGTGKSTLMALLLRLFDPDDGKILVEGVELTRIRVESLRAHVSIALQENLLFATTVRENIRYASPDAREDRLLEAARVACADEFIAELPRGYDTLLGERGTKLSTGQRQRLTIARAILKDTPVLILDEPTAALDAETELRLMRNLSEWGKDRIVFIVTHRLSTIRRADQILYLHNGTIAEHGSHAQLMGHPQGRYRALVELEENSGAAAGDIAEGA